MITYVFDFYNLYIPKGKKYVNEKYGIRVIPLKHAEEFEKNRRKLSSPFSKNGGWKIAKCYIKAPTRKKAESLAGALEFLYSFAQSRSVFFIGSYEYKKGRKYSYSATSKFIEPRENRFSELVYATITTRGYTRDISLFIDTALDTIIKTGGVKEKSDILIGIHAYNISKSQMVQELKFLIIWSALERLSNTYYSKHKSVSENHLFTKEELNKLHETLGKTLDKYLKGDKRLGFVKRTLKRKFLYEHDTSQKIMLYLGYLDVGFDKRILKKCLNKLIQIRVGLVHRLDSVLLLKQPQYLMYLQKIMEQVIFRLLGVSPKIQDRFLLHQYNRGEL